MTGSQAEHKVIFLKGPGAIRFKSSVPIRFRPPFHHVLPRRHLEHRFPGPLSGEEKFFHGLEQPHHALKKPEYFHDHHQIDLPSHEVDHENFDVDHELDLEHTHEGYSNPLDAHAEVEASETYPNAHGEYEFGFKASNGIVREESGVAGQYVKGFSQYISPEGELVTLKYVADENGFHAEGSHIPKTPEHVVESLAWNEAHPEENEEAVEENFYEF